MQKTKEIQHNPQADANAAHFFVPLPRTSKTD